jgi:glycosyltransferase involved in cell wall biosynthesis
VGLGVADRVHFPGRVAPHEVYAWYRAADVVASLSRRECFGMTVAEGLSAGANVLASDIGPHRDVLDLVQDPPAALLPADATPDDVAAGISALGRRRSGPPPVFPTWTAVAEKVVRAYEAAIFAGNHAARTRRTQERSP